MAAPKLGARMDVSITKARARSSVSLAEVFGAYCEQRDREAALAKREAALAERESQLQQWAAELDAFAATLPDTAPSAKSPKPPAPKYHGVARAF